MPSKSPPKAYLVVYGDRSGLAAIGNAFSRFFEPRGVEKTYLYHPNRAEVISALEGKDGFWYWGHGDNGALRLCIGEYLAPDDIPINIQLERAELRACYSLMTPEVGQKWLRVAKEVSGFRGVTMETWGLIHRMVHMKRAG